MRKALTSFATGQMRRTFLDFTLPRMARYALRHGYDLVVPHDPTDPDMAPSWAKVGLLEELLGRYDLVLWLDADVLIVDGREDVAGDLDEDFCMGLVGYGGGPSRGFTPSCAVWLLRKSWETSRILRKLRPENCPKKFRAMWEQGALWGQMGIEGFPVELPATHAFPWQTISRHWNVGHEAVDDFPQHLARFLHVGDRDRDLLYTHTKQLVEEWGEMK